MKSWIDAGREITEAKKCTETKREKVAITKWGLIIFVFSDIFFIEDIINNIRGLNKLINKYLINSKCSQNFKLLNREIKGEVIDYGF